MDASSPAGLSKSESTQKWVNLLLFLAPINALLVFDRIALIVSAPIIQKQLHLSLVDIAVLISSVMWTYGLLQIPSGWLVAKYGPRRMMLGALLLWSVSTMLTPLAQTLIGLIVLRILLGVGQAPDWAASVASVRSWFGATERSRGTSIILSGQYLGAAFAGPITTMIVAKTNWQTPFYLYGGVGLFLTVMFFLFFQERQVEAESNEGKAQATAGRDLVFALLRQRRFWCLGGIYACILSVGAFVSYLLPNYLIDQRHVSYQTMGVLVGLPIFFQWAGVLLGAFLADKIVQTTNSVWRARVPLGAAGLMLAGCATALVPWIDDLFVMTCCLCLSFFCLAFAQVSLWSSVQDLSLHHTGILTGWTNAWGNLSAAAAPILIAKVVSVTLSWKLGLAVPLTAGCLGAFLMSQVMPQRPFLVSEEESLPPPVG